MHHHTLLDNKTNVAVTDIDRPLKWKFIALNGNVGILKCDTFPSTAPTLVQLPVPSMAGSSRVFHRVHLLGEPSLKGTPGLPATADWAVRRAGGLTPSSIVVPEEKKSTTCLMCPHPSASQWQLYINWHKSPMSQPGRHIGTAFSTIAS